jgi:hypothetical protein
MKAKASGFVKYELNEEFTHLRNIDRIIFELEAIIRVFRAQVRVMDKFLAEFRILFSRESSYAHLRRDDSSSVYRALDLFKELHNEAQRVRDKVGRVLSQILSLVVFY